MTYIVVFDIADVGYKSWTFAASGLIVVIAGAFLVSVRRNFPGWWKAHPRISAAFAFFFLGFAILWTAVTFILTYRDYASATSAQSAGRARVVEGRVSRFKPMPFSGHAMERFCVENECFEYSDYVVTAGFNNTSSHGGPIKADLPVRVTSVGNTIIKLEVAR